MKKTRKTVFFFFLPFLRRVSSQCREKPSRWNRPWLARACVVMHRQMVEEVRVDYSNDSSLPTIGNMSCHDFFSIPSFFSLYFCWKDGWIEMSGESKLPLRRRIKRSTTEKRIILDFFVIVQEMEGSWSGIFLTTVIAVVQLYANLVEASVENLPSSFLKRQTGRESRQIRVTLTIQLVWYFVLWDRLSEFQWVIGGGPWPGQLGFDLVGLGLGLVDWVIESTRCGGI